ncbi:MAG TPA: hypothetical protein VFW50_03885 [Streptosporangiaceae bacterium]|nr:hypothetical protein [Streptosporangiaceae bacterium]
MNHFGDEYPPGRDARPYLPTEIDHPYQPDDNAPGYPPAADAHGYRLAADASGYLPAADARGYLPTEIEHPGPSPDGGSGYQATYTGTGEPAPPYSPGRTGSHAPGHAAPGGLTRYGPGVPATPAASAPHAAERIWRSGHADQSPRRPPPRPGRWRGRGGAALTVILLAASAVVLFMRFHHAPFHVTGVAIAPPARNGCGVDVTAEVSTNGAAGTVSYQWLFRPEGQAPQPLSKSVAAGQDAVYVTVAVRGSGHGTASRTVTLQVLGPDVRSASIPVTLRC